MQTRPLVFIASLLFVFLGTSSAEGKNLRSWVTEILRCDPRHKKPCATLDDALGKVEEELSQVEVLAVEEKDDKIIAYVSRSRVPFRYQLSRSGKVLSRECRSDLPKEGSDFLDVSHEDTERVPGLMRWFEPWAKVFNHVAVVEDRCRSTGAEQNVWIYPLQEGRLGKPRNEMIALIGDYGPASEESPAILIPHGSIKVVSSEGIVQVMGTEKLPSEQSAKEAQWKNVEVSTSIQADDWISLESKSSIVLSIAGLEVKWKTASRPALLRFSTDTSLKTAWEQIQKIRQKKDVRSIEWNSPYMRLDDDVYELSGTKMKFHCHLEAIEEVPFAWKPLVVSSLATEKGVMLQTTHGIILGRCRNSR